MRPSPRRCLSPQPHELAVTAFDCSSQCDGFDFDQASLVQSGHRHQRPGWAMVAKGVRVDLVEQRLVFRTDDESGHLENPLWRGAAGPDDGEYVRKRLPDLRIESHVLKAGPVRSDRKLTGHEYKSCTSQPLHIGAGR